MPTFVEPYTELVIENEAEARCDTVRTRDREGRLLFEFDYQSNRALLYLPGAVLQFRCVNGDVEIIAPGRISIRSEKSVEISADNGVLLGTPGSYCAVGPNRVMLDSERVEVRSDSAVLQGKSLSASADQIKVSCGKLEQVVGRAFQYARHVYQRVEVMLHTKAGRIRTEALGTHLLQADSARIQAKQDVRIQGDSINLG